MTGLFLDISDYIPDPEEMAVDSALAYLSRQGVQEDYIIVPSAINDMPRLKPAKRRVKKTAHEWR